MVLEMAHIPLYKLTVKIYKSQYRVDRAAFLKFNDINFKNITCIDLLKTISNLKQALYMVFTQMNEVLRESSHKSSFKLGQKQFDMKC